MTSSTSFVLPVDPGLRNTFGIILVGLIFAAVLFGVVNIQAFVYFRAHRGTGMTFFKIVVLFLWMLDTLHMILITHFIYHYLVVNYANFAAFTEIVWSAKLHVIPAISIVWSIHILYVYRIWIVSRGRSRVLPIIVGITVTLDLAAGVIAIWEIYRCHLFTDLLRMEWSMLLCLSMIGFTDFVVASSLVYLLATSRTGFSSTDSLLTKLVVYIINTGCLTSMVSIATIITCAVIPTNFAYMALQFVGAKVYVNSFLALMNAQYYQGSYTDADAELNIIGSTHRPDLRTSMKPEDDSLHTPQVNIPITQSCIPALTVQATMPQLPPIATKTSMRSVSEPLEQSMCSSVR